MKRLGDVGRREEKGGVRAPITVVVEVLDGRAGVIQAAMGAIGVFLKYAFLWEQE